MLEGNDYPNWQVGEEIVIAPSGWNPEEAEIRTITSYDSSSGMLHTAADCRGGYRIYERGGGGGGHYILNAAGGSA